MEKRLVLFITISVVVMMAYTGLKLAFAPLPVAELPADEPGKGDQRPDDAGPQGGDAREAAGENTEKADDPNQERTGSDPATNRPPGDETEPGQPQAPGDAAAQTRPDAREFRERHLVLGSFEPGREGNLLVYFNSAGGSIERVEMVGRRRDGRLKFRNLEEERGYLGYLAAVSEPDGGGCRVQVVAPGTPAAEAVPQSGTNQRGLQPGDVIVRAGEIAIETATDLQVFLAKQRPGAEIALTVLRPPTSPDAAPTENADRVQDPDAIPTNEQLEAAREPQEIAFTTRLTSNPLQLIHLEPDFEGDYVPSFLLTLQQLGQLKLRDDEELDGLRMRTADWEVVKETESEVAFRYQIPAEVLQRAGIDGPLYVIKRYILDAAAPAATDASAPSSHLPYHLRYFVEFQYGGQQNPTVAIQQDGPNGLPLEGWWYSTKLSPSWGGAGARDVVWRLANGQHRLLSTSKIHKAAEDNKVSLSLLSGKALAEDRTLDYIGVDTQYFTAVMLPGGPQDLGQMVVQSAAALAIGELGNDRGRLAQTQNVSFRLESLPQEIPSRGQPDGNFVFQEFTLFLGPKDSQVLAEYSLSDLIEYGWFGFVARPLSWVLHTFYFFVRNYGLAIILLTVLVRGAMFPLGRKTARNAQKMQELAPEIKKINEKYKNDMEKRAAATRELWKQHNFHPLGGCWLMFIQLPIFIGLYRCLSVDIELRQAPLIPGLDWASNLAGPDMLLYWESETFGFLTGETGWLGPYLNILPIVTIALFLVQQKMFTPPATDEQTEMQQKMMKYMMIFFGVLFFKVPSGLCLYFIASSLWGIAERKLLPKSSPPASTPVTKEKKPSKFSAFFGRMNELIEEANRAAQANRKQQDSGNGSTRGDREGRESRDRKRQRKR